LNILQTGEDLSAILQKDASPETRVTSGDAGCVPEAIASGLGYAGVSGHGGADAFLFDMNLHGPFAALMFRF
jgi:hypothetical protein